MLQTHTADARPRFVMRRGTLLTAAAFLFIAATLYGRELASNFFPSLSRGGKTKGHSRKQPWLCGLTWQQVSDLPVPELAGNITQMWERQQSCERGLLSPPAGTVHPQTPAAPRLSLSPLLFHTYIEGVDWASPTASQDFLLAPMSFLLTQDTAKAQFWLWLPQQEIAAALHPGTRLSALLAANPSLQVKRWDYDSHALGTPLQASPRFRNGTAMRASLTLVTYSDLVRLLLLSRYGGLWLDADAWLLRDAQPLLCLGRQFHPKDNNHVLFRLPAQQSHLITKTLQAALLFPMQSPSKWPQLEASTYILSQTLPLRAWVYNSALLTYMQQQQDSGGKDKQLLRKWRQWQASSSGGSGGEGLQKEGEQKEEEQGEQRPYRTGSALLHQQFPLPLGLFDPLWAESYHINLEEGNRQAYSCPLIKQMFCSGVPGVEEEEQGEGEEEEP